MSTQTAKRAKPKPARPHAHQTQKRYRRRRAMWMPVSLGAVIVVIAALVAVLATRTPVRPGARTTDLPVTAAVSVSGTALMPYAHGGSDRSIGATAPAVRGTTFAGTPLSIVNDGHAKAFIFLAHWCPHCRDEVPKIVSWLKAGGDVHGVDLYAVSTWASAAQANYPPGPWLEREHWTIPTLVDDGTSTVANAYGLVETPMFVFVSRSGAVVQRVTGELSTSDLEKVLARTAAA